MTAREAIAIVSRMSYTPESTVEAQISMHGTALEVMITKMVPDVKTGQPIKQIAIQVMPYESLQKAGVPDLIKFVRDTIVGLEQHEIDEWFKLDGRHIRSPHPEFELKQFDYDF